MKYQLVLQWPLSAINYDKLIAVENLLVHELSENDEVDGHDIGSGEANIFVLTDSPKRSWERARLILEENEVGSSVRAAYRHLAEDEYVILWPQNLSHFNVI